MRSAVSSRTHSSAASSSIRPIAAFAAACAPWTPPLGDIVFLGPQRSDQGREREALQHERHENHAERQEDDQVASGERAPASVWSGSARAAARETAPRMPIQETSIGYCQGG